MDFTGRVVHQTPMFHADKRAYVLLRPANIGTLLHDNKRDTVASRMCNATCQSELNVELTAGVRPAMR